MKMAESITINAPRDRVFEVASDIQNAAARIPDITRIQMLDEGPIRVGSRWRETRKMWGKEHTETLEIAELRAPEFYAVKAHSCGTDYDTAFEFRSDSPNSTVMTFTFQGTPRTLAARVMGAVMAPLMKGTMRKCLRSDLESVKRACEGANNGGVTSA